MSDPDVQPLAHSDDFVVRRSIFIALSGLLTAGGFVVSS